ncbi:MAG: hypothetical protein ACRC0X_10180, partial [Brevinema sp.]
PILVLDREGGDFYRYYEYRIIEANRFVGAIRIPTYRRTENFATSEVHVYNADEKTYTIHPTGWGQYMAAKIRFKLDTTIYQTISNQIYHAFSDTVAYNFALRHIKSNLAELPKLNHNSDMLKAQMVKQLTKTYGEDQYIKKLKNQVQLDPKWAKESYEKFATQFKSVNFNKINKNLEIQAQRIAALKMIDSMRETYTIVQTEGLSIALLGSLQLVFLDMGSSPQHNNSMKKRLKQLYWRKFEIGNFQMFEEFDISPLLDKENISLELHYFNSPVDNSKIYITDDELLHRMSPYVSWRYKKEEFKIYGQLPMTRARPGADDTVIRNELVSSFNDAIGDIIGATGQLGAGIIKGDDWAIIKMIFDVVKKIVAPILKDFDMPFEIEGGSELEMWFKDISAKWDNINTGQQEEIGWNFTEKINENSEKAHKEMDKIFEVFKETLYGTKDPATGLYSGGMCDVISIINDTLTSLTDSDGNSLNGLSPDDGKHIAFLLELCDPNKTEKEVDNELLKIMYTQMAGYGNDWIIPKKPYVMHHLVHLSRSLDWGKKKFFHIDHKFIKPRNLTASEQKRYPVVREGGYGAYARKKRGTWKAHGSRGW